MTMNRNTSDKTVIFGNNEVVKDCLTILFCHSNLEDITIDIFHEDLMVYLQKLLDANIGRYELDNYDWQVINIAMDQFKN